ncbi:MAG TPA: hypothetical protein VLV83_18255 [Acidobacteriota bacterium]|nr:hypothetical protein [Acidobacteriota bacterium]
MKRCSWILLMAALAAASCGPRQAAALYPASQRDQVAQDVLEFHEDRFLADHNQELAQAWEEYRAARQRLVELWQQQASTVHADPEQRRQAQDEVGAAKADFVKTAERLRELSQNMASEAAHILHAALRIPPILGYGSSPDDEKP